MCLRRAPEKYIAGAALDRAALATNNLEISRNRTSKDPLRFSQKYGNIMGTR
jgi:hypothetical protein